MSGMGSYKSIWEGGGEMGGGLTRTFDTVCGFVVGSVFYSSEAILIIIIVIIIIIIVTITVIECLMAWLSNTRKP